MERKKASDFDRGLLDLFDGYVHGDISRREFLDRARVYAVGGVTAAALLDSLSPKYAEAQQVAPDDERLETKYVEYDSPQGYGKVKALLARPAGSSGKLPGVVVIHENRGLNPHIEDERVNAGWPAYEAALKANGVDYTQYIYEETNHGFHNDTTPRYDEEAAKLAWQRTLDFFAKHLR